MGDTFFEQSVFFDQPGVIATLQNQVGLIPNQVNTQVINASSGTLTDITIGNLNITGVVSGIVGSTGPTGSQGPQGVNGLPGIQGHTGPQGETGPQGPQGTSGLPGSQGNTGPQGSTGSQGPQGLNSLWQQSGTDNAVFFTGSVAIGKTSPITTLDVVGTVSLTGGAVSIYSNLNMFNNQIQNPIFNSVKETLFISSYSGAFILNCNTGNNFAITLSSGANSVSFLNPPSTGTIFGLNMFVSQGAVGNRNLSYPSSVTWGAQGVPALSTGANQTDILNFITYSGGSKWIGFLCGKGF